MNASIAPLGPSSAVLRAKQGPNGSGMVSQATGLTAKGPEAYSAAYSPYVPGAAYPAYGYPQPSLPPQAPALNVGRLLSWAGGGFAAFKWVLPLVGRGNPAGWLVATVIGGGAMAGNWLYNKVTGQGVPRQALPPGQVAPSSLPVGKIASIGAGALAAFRFVVPRLGSPSGLAIAGVVGAGAFVGNWLYKAITGK